MDGAKSKTGMTSTLQTSIPIPGSGRTLVAPYREMMLGAYDPIASLNQAKMISTEPIVETLPLQQ